MRGQLHQLRKRKEAACVQDCFAPNGKQMHATAELYNGLASQNGRTMVLSVQGTTWTVDEEI